MGIFKKKVFSFCYNRVNVLKLGLSFTTTPPQNIPDLEYDLYQFSRKFRLTYHFRNSNFQDASLVKILCHLPLHQMNTKN